MKKIVQLRLKLFICSASIIQQPKGSNSMDMWLIYETRQAWDIITTQKLSMILYDQRAETCSPCGIQDVRASQKIRPIRAPAAMLFCFRSEFRFIMQKVYIRNILDTHKRRIKLCNVHMILIDPHQLDILSSLLRENVSK